MKTLERLAAESLGESEKEPEEAMPRNANTGVKRIRAFVVVDLMCDLMGANRITFEDKEIRLVGPVALENSGYEGAGYLLKKSMRSSATRAGSSC